MTSSLTLPGRGDSGAYGSGAGFDRFSRSNAAAILVKRQSSTPASGFEHALARGISGNLAPHVRSGQPPSGDEVLSDRNSVVSGADERVADVDGQPEIGEPNGVAVDRCRQRLAGVAFAEIYQLLWQFVARTGEYACL